VYEVTLSPGVRILPPPGTFIVTVILAIRGSVVKPRRAEEFSPPCDFGIAAALSPTPQMKTLPRGVPGRVGRRWE